MKSLLCLLAGTAIGAVSSYALTKKALEKKYDKLYQEEVDEYKRHVKNDILKADNLEAHDKKIKEEVEQAIYAKLSKPYDVDEDETFDTTVYRESDNLPESDTADFDYTEDEMIHIVNDDGATYLECERDYEILYYKWSNLSDTFLYQDKIRINVSDILPDTSILIGYETGDKIYIADHSNECVYIIEVIDDDEIC